MSWVRILFALVAVAALGAVALVRPPDPAAVAQALSGVSWSWLSLALLANAVSILARAAAWRALLAPVAERRPPPLLPVLSAYSVGLLGNTLLPARAGDVARIVVLRRHLPAGANASATVTGSVVAQHCLDAACFAVLAGVVVATGQVPGWLLGGTLILGALGMVVIGLAVAFSHRARRRAFARGRPWLAALAGEGLGALSRPRQVARAGALQLVGWAAQLLVVDLTLRAFSAPVPLLASALVLVAVNGVLAFPLWPGGVGAYQAVVALALAPYGIASATGISLGIGIQAVETLVGVAFGLWFAAHEGLSLAALRRSERYSGGPPPPSGG